MPHRNVLAMLALLFPVTAAFAQDAKPAEPPPPITEKMKADAAKLSPLVTSELAKQFLAATAKLAEPTPRTV